MVPNELIETIKQAILTAFSDKKNVRVTLGYGQISVEFTTANFDQGEYITFKLFRELDIVIVYDLYANLYYTNYGDAFERVLDILEQHFILMYTLNTSRLDGYIEYKDTFLNKRTNNLIRVYYGRNNQNTN